MICKRCGREIPEDSVFCEYCGTKQSTGDTAKIPVQRERTAAPPPRKGEKIKRGIKKIYLYSAILLFIFIGAFLLIEKPWNFKEPTPPKRPSPPKSSQTEPVEKRPTRDSKRPGGFSLGDRDKPRDRDSEEGPKEEKVPTESVTRSMTPVEIAQEHDCLIGAPDTIHIEWVDHDTAIMTLASFEPGQFGVRPPDWYSDRWEIWDSFEVKYSQDEDSVEFYGVDYDGSLYILCEMKFLVEDGFVTFVELTQYDDKGNSETMIVPYWIDFIAG